MGIPEKNRPLPNRLNVVLTNDNEWASTLPEGVLSARSLSQAIDLIVTNDIYKNSIEKLVIVGGAQLFEESLFHPLCNEYHVTKINQEFASDTYLTKRTQEKLDSLTPTSVSDEITESGISYKMYVYDPSKSL